MNHYVPVPIVPPSIQYASVLGLPVVACTRTLTHVPRLPRSVHGLRPGELMRPGDYRESPNKNYALRFQEDGNLVLYNPAPIWSTDTWGRGARRCQMGMDGNFAIYGETSDVLWETETSGHPRATLQVQDDGNIVVYDPAWQDLWASGVPSFSLQHELDPLNGRITITCSADGTIGFQGHVHNARLEALKYSIVAITKGPDGARIALKKSGSLPGKVSLSGKSRNAEWDEVSANPVLAQQFNRFHPDAQLEVHEDREGAITGVVDDALSLIIKWTIGAIALNPASALLIFAGAEMASLLKTGSFAPAGRVLSGYLWMAGPYGTFYAVAGEALGRIGTERREISAGEYKWAQDEVFAGTLPERKSIILTDTLGISNRPFVFPQIDGKISVNLGAQLYKAPLSDLRTFVHELVHVWQVKHIGTESAWLVDALVTQTVNGRDAYKIPSLESFPQPLPNFGSFNLEQQAEIVERWYMDTKNWPPGEHANHILFPYMAGNIWVGKV